ncbi:MAG TPA: hypothetical protein VF595_17300 [Tepidisphaeraceae bacterium]|jgi:hypothetical protein
MKHRPSPYRIVSIAVLCVGSTAHAAATSGEAQGPREVYRAYSAALATGDIDAAKKLIVADAKRMPLVDNRRPAAEAEKRYRAAVDKAFPGAARPLGYGAPTTRPADAPDPLRLTVTNDTATLTVKDTTESVRLRRVNGEWKVDLNAMYAPATVDEIEQFRGALVEVMNALAAEVAAGRFKTYDEVLADLETRVKMRLATPDSPSTTRPAL